MRKKCSLISATGPVARSHSKPSLIVLSNISTFSHLWIKPNALPAGGWGNLGVRSGRLTAQVGWSEGQSWSTMGKTRHVPRLSNSCSWESSSRSSASSAVLRLFFPLEPQPDPPATTTTPLAVMAVSPNMKVRSPSLQMRSVSWSLSCSWFCKHNHIGTLGEG